MATVKSIRGKNDDVAKNSAKIGTSVRFTEMPTVLYAYAYTKIAVSIRPRTRTRNGSRTRINQT